MLTRSLPIRILAVNFIVLALPLLVDSFIFFQRSYDHSINYAKSALKETANYRAFALAELDPIQQVTLKQIIVLLNLQQEILHLPNKEFNEKLQGMSEMGVNFHLYVLDNGLNGEYKILASNDPNTIGENYPNASSLRQIIQSGGDGNYLEHRFSKNAQMEVPVAFVVHAIKDPQTDQLLGVLVISSEIQEALKPLLQPSHDGNVLMNFAVLNNAGIVYAATNPDLVGNYFTPLSSDERNAILKSGQFRTQPLAQAPLEVFRGKDSFFEFVFNDELKIAYLVQLPKIDVNFLAYAGKQQLFSSSIQHFLLVYLIYGLIFLIGGGITYWLTFWISRPFKQLSELMERAGKGDFDVRFKEEPFGFEINILGGIFNETLKTLLDNIQKAEDEKVLKEMYQKELEIGQEVQRKLLPQKVVEIPGVELAASYSSPSEVGGDFYDIYEIDPERIALTIEDAAGKGISACLYALGVRSYIRTYLTLYDDLGEILSHVNNMFIKDIGDSGMFVTALMAIFDVAKKRLRYVSCGHIPVLLRRAEGQLEHLTQSGIALGLKESTHFDVKQLLLASGDILLLYTAGILKLTNHQGENFGEERLERVVQSKKWINAQEMIDAILHEVQHFMGDATRTEEITLLAMRIV